jgi:hypothetical protein
MTRLEAIRRADALAATAERDLHSAWALLLHHDEDSSERAELATAQDALTKFRDAIERRIAELGEAES